ncbi:hypothetical protein [Maricaulis sp.]|uniref:hypothetical protein n=1 Tax=Maricaulis sp. TaxID=1486257 RepID=UPI00261C1FE9|nr:hypothetical protein [Maricaulis sp.]
MSILETPRLYFRGNIGWDPVTTNNFPASLSDQPAAYDENTLDSTLHGQPVTPSQVGDYRQAAIDEVPLQKDGLSSWNPDGTYRSTFFQTQVNGVDLGNGLDIHDPIVTAPVNFQGMLIDVEPYGPYTSQLFFDEMSFGIPGGCRIVGPRWRRFDDRNINFNANPSNSIIAGTASVTWQTVFPKRHGLAIEEHDSPLLQAFRAALSSEDVLGLMVRWNSYRTIYFNNPAQRNGNAAQQHDSENLIAKLNQGGFQPNPARSLVVGCLGLWRRGDCPSEPGERTLVSTLAPIPDQGTPASAGRVGTAFMHIDSASSPPKLTLDFQNTIPCADQATDKVDLGTLSVIAADPPPAVAMGVVAEIPLGRYDRRAYEATGGIVTVDLPDGSRGLEDYVFSISGPDGGPTYLQEVRYRALTDEPNVYVTQGDLRDVTIQVYDRGRPAGAGLNVVWSPLQGTGSTDTTHWSATTDANGRVKVPLDTSQGLVYPYIFQVGDDPVLPVVSGKPQHDPHAPGVVFNPLVFTYVYVRVLPRDDEIAALEPTWDNVYAHVLANFKAIAPCMDNWLRLDDEQQVRAYGPLVKRLTDPDAFESFRYMPATRDLSPGQRTLLYNWLDRQAAHEKPERPVELEALMMASEESAVLEIATIAGSHRGGGKPE